MRVLAVLSASVLVAIGAVAGPAVAATNGEAASLHTTSAPQSFRWLPYPGVPSGQYCDVVPNDVGSAAITVRNAQGDSSLWVAGATGGRSLPIPEKYTLQWVPTSTGLSDTGIAAAVVQATEWEQDPSGQRLVRWDTYGIPTLSPSMATSDMPVRLKIVGVTKAGHVMVVAIPAFGHNPDGTVLLWMADGTVKPVITLPGLEWYGRISTLAYDDSFTVSWEFPYEAYTQWVRPASDWSGVAVHRLATTVDALSSDGRWIAGRSVSYGPPRPDDLPEKTWTSGYTKGAASPLAPYATQAVPGSGVLALAINNQGTTLLMGTSSSLRWVNGSRWTDVRPNTTRVPFGATVALPEVPRIDTAGRIAARVVTGSSCRAGVVAPQW